VRIERLVGVTYYATVELRGAFGDAAIDARPSDALNVAALTGSTIRAATDVLSDADLAQNKDIYSRLTNALANDAPSSSAIAAEAKERWERSTARFAEEDASE
jgi:bifunctional DNase/RNase